MSNNVYEIDNGNALGQIISGNVQYVDINSAYAASLANRTAPTDKLIVIKPGVYNVTSEIIVGSGFPNNSIDGVTHLYFEPGAVVNATVDTGLGAFKLSGANVKTRILGHGTFNNYGIKPMFYVHAGFSGIGDQAIEFDSCYHYGLGPNFLLEDADITIRGNRCWTMADLTDYIPIYITNSETNNKAIIEIASIKSFSTCVIFDAASLTSRTIFRNCFLEKKSGGDDRAVVSDLVSSEARCFFQNCLIKNSTNSANAHGISMGNGIDGQISLMGTGIYTTHASSKSITGVSSLQSAGSIANKATATTTETAGALTVDADFTII